MNGHVLLYSRGEPIRDPEKQIKKIKEIAPQVEAVTGSFVFEMMISGPSRVSGVVLEGIDSGSLGRVTEIPLRLKEGRLPNLDEAWTGEGEFPVTLGSALAEKIGARVGDSVKFVAPFLGGEGEADTGGAPRVFPARVVGLVKMGMHDYDIKWAFADLHSVQKILSYPGRVTTFKMKLKRLSDAKAVAEKLGENFGYPFRAREWSSLNQNLFRAIEHQKAVISISLVLIVLVAAFNVVSTLMMMIYDKTKEISILKAMGFKPSQSFHLFCSIGVGIGLVGTVFGIIGALLMNTFLAKTRFIELPPDIYSIGFLPVVTDWTEVAWIGGIAFLICFLAMIYPVWQVARRAPLDGIRYE
jgi:lipoprotein-releasing system permease protein